MKKIMLFILCCCCLCGCNKKSNDWEDKIKVSSLAIDQNTIIGKVENLTQHDYHIKLIIEFKNSEEIECLETIKAKNTIHLKCPTNNKVSDTDTPRLKEVILEEFDSSMLEERELSLEEFETQFKNIYDAHLLNFTSFKDFGENDQYPYIDTIIYVNKKITMEGTISKENHSIHYSETYYTDSSKLYNIYFYVTDNGDTEFTNNLLTKISTMNALSTNTEDSEEIHATLLRTDIKEGDCVTAGNWCISTVQSDDLNSYLILTK